MEALMDHFVTSLGLSKHYTVVVLNPAWSASEAAYSYRLGLSLQEINLISKEKEQVMRLLQVTCVRPRLQAVRTRGREQINARLLDHGLIFGGERAGRVCG
eukprot:353304-Chlamydomonas_euryale.AAC.10